MASWIAVFVIDRIGRRKLMIFGAIGMSASMAILCGTIYAATETDVVERGIGPINGLDNKGAGFAAAVMLFVYKYVGSIAREPASSEADDLYTPASRSTFFAIGWLGMTWLYPAEVRQLATRQPVIKC